MYLHNSSAESELISAYFRTPVLKTTFRTQDLKCMFTFVIGTGEAARTDCTVNHNITTGVCNNSMKRSGPQVVN